MAVQDEAAGVQARRSLRARYRLVTDRKGGKDMPKIEFGRIASLALIATAVAVWIALFQGWDSL